jgi:thiol-disulfide isomerase/thioredoxin
VTVRLLVLAALALLTAAAWWWRRREGRMVPAHGFFEPADLGLAPDARPSAVVVEFSGEGCAPCRVVEARVGAVAAELPDVRVVTIDAGRRLDLADRYHVRRVPTLFVADPELRVVWRASGVVSEEALREALLGPAWAGRPHPRTALRRRPRARRHARPRARRGCGRVLR